MKENYYLIVSFLKSCYSYDHDCVMPCNAIILKFIRKLYCVITDFVNNFMKIIIDTFNSMLPQYYTNN